MSEDDSSNKEPPIQVFIMMGQSNMLGFGQVGNPDKDDNKVGSLSQLISEGQYTEFRPDGNKWWISENVRYVQTMVQRNQMKVVHKQWLTIPNKQKFGPEVGFGKVIGQYYATLDKKQRILLLKACIGNRSLGWDLLPPGSEQYEHDGHIYAGYKDSPSQWKKGTIAEPIKWYAGKQYDDDVNSCKEVLSKIGDYVGGATEYEIAGFLWWQGHKDTGSEAHTSHYEENLVRLIHSLRKEFNAPQAKFCLATLGHDGMEQKGRFLRITQAQLAVSDNPDQYPEFVGNVKTVDARPYWRSQEVSPANQHHHYHQNAAVFIDVGRAMGHAMVELLQQQQCSS